MGIRSNVLEPLQLNYKKSTISSSFTQRIVSRAILFVCKVHMLKVLRSMRAPAEHALSTSRAALKKGKLAKHVMTSDYDMRFLSHSECMENASSSTVYTLYPKLSLRPKLNFREHHNETHHNYDHYA